MSQNNHRNFSNTEAMSVAIGGASSPKMPIEKRRDLAHFLVSMAQAYIHGLSAISKATAIDDEIHEVCKHHLETLLKTLKDKLAEIEDGEQKT